jgi:nitrate reductase NapE component
VWTSFLNIFAFLEFQIFHIISIAMVGQTIAGGRVEL